MFFGKSFFVHKKNLDISLYTFERLMLVALRFEEKNETFSRIY